MKNKIVPFSIFLISVSFIGLMIYSNLNPTPERIPGKYKAVYSGGEDYLTLVGDGTYRQKFVIKEKTIYSNSGKWKISDDGIHILFDNYINAISGGDCSIKPNKPNYGLGSWHQLNHIISMNEDCGQVYRRY